MTGWTPQEARSAIEREIMQHSELVTVLASSVDGDDVVIEFAVAERPGCRFGFRFPTHGEAQDDLQTHATVARVNVDEEIEAVGRELPDATPGQLAWLPS